MDPHRINTSRFFKVDHRKTMQDYAGGIEIETRSRTDANGTEWNSRSSDGGIFFFQNDVKQRKREI